MKGLVWITLAALLEGQVIVRPRIARIEAQDIPPNPAVLILLPTTQDTYSTSASALTLSGSCQDDVACTSVTWSCATCTTTSGTATGTASWSFSVTLASGANTITVTGHDASANTGTDTLTATYSASDASPPTPTITTNGGSNYSVTTGTTSLAGTCSDNVGCTNITVSLTDGSGTCTGTSSWTCNDIALKPCTTSCANTITVTGFDQAGNTGTDSIVVTQNVPLSITTVSLNACTLNVACTLYVDATGGDGVYTFTKQTGSWLTGSPAFAITTTSNRGVITGTCTSGGETQAVTFRVTDGALTTADSGSITLRCTDPATSTYFQTISALAAAQAITDCVTTGDTKGCSLQRQSQLDILAQNPNDPQAYTYDAAANAAKLTWLRTDASPKSTIRIPVHQTTGTLLFIWDIKYGISWARSACGGNIPDALAAAYSHKEFQLAHSADGTGEGTIFFENKTYFDTTSPYTCASGNVGYLGVRIYGNNPYSFGSSILTNLKILDPNPVQAGAAAPGTNGAGTATVKTTPFKHGQWTRYWLEYRLNQDASAFTSWNSTYGITVPAGTYHMASLWAAGEDWGPVRLIYQMPHQRVKGTGATLTGIAKFWYEHNTSATHPEARGNVTIAGTATTSIPKNTVFTRSLGGSCGNWQWRTTAATTIETDGDVVVEVAATPTDAYGGPCGNLAASTTLTATLSGITSVTVASGGLTGGAYLLNGDLIAHSRWFQMLKGYTLPPTPEDDTTIFVRPIP